MMLERGFEEMLEFAISEMRCNTGDLVLDFGCGNGRFVRAMREKGILAYGCDIAPKFRGDIFLQRQGLEECDLTQMIYYYKLGEELPFQSSKFQAIFSYQTFEHIKNFESSVKEMSRVLGGGDNV